MNNMNKESLAKSLDIKTIEDYNKLAKRTVDFNNKLEKRADELQEQATKIMNDLEENPANKDLFIDYVLATEL